MRLPISKPVHFKRSNACFSIPHTKWTKCRLLLRSFLTPVKNLSLSLCLPVPLSAISKMWERMCAKKLIYVCFCCLEWLTNSCRCSGLPFHHLRMVSLSVCPATTVTLTCTASGVVGMRWSDQNGAIDGFTASDPESGAKEERPYTLTLFSVDNDDC